MSRVFSEICKLKLQKLDLSDNRISTIPNEYCQMIDTLEDIRLQNNPLVSPPAKVCSYMYTRFQIVQNNYSCVSPCFTVRLPVLG